MAAAFLFRLTQTVPKNAGVAAGVGVAGFSAREAPPAPSWVLAENRSGCHTASGCAAG